MCISQNTYVLKKTTSNLLFKYSFCHTCNKCDCHVTVTEFSRPIGKTCNRRQRLMPKKGKNMLYLCIHRKYVWFFLFPKAVISVIWKHYKNMSHTIPNSGTVILKINPSGTILMCINLCLAHQQCIDFLIQRKCIHPIKKH